MGLITWNDADFFWDSNPHLWNLVVEAVEEIATPSGGVDFSALDKLEKEKKKKLVRLIMYRNGVKEYDEEKEVKNIKAKAKDIELIIKEVKSSVKVII